MSPLARRLGDEAPPGSPESSCPPSLATGPTKGWEGCPPGPAAHEAGPGGLGVLGATQRGTCHPIQRSYTLRPPASSTGPKYRVPVLLS